MRLLFCSRPAYGHVYPLMPLANAARAAGHDVGFASAGEFVGKLERLGFRTVDVGPTFEEAFERFAADGYPAGIPRGPDGRPDLGAGGHLFVDVFGRATASDLLPMLTGLAPDVVVYEHYDVGAGVAAEAAGVPAVAMLVSPLLPEPIEHHVVGEKLAKLRADFGVTTDPGVRSADPFLDPFPDAVQEARARRPGRIRLRPAAYCEPGGAVPDWIELGERPLVYVTLGTVVAGDDVLRPAIEAVSGLDADVLVALGSADGATLGTLPPNVRVERFVDQGRVMAQAALAVHHGGSGTMLDCLRQGVPQVVLPKGADQFVNGDALSARGLASVLEPPVATPEAIRDAASAALGRLPDAAEAARREIATLPGPVRTLAHLDALRAR